MPDPERTPFFSFRNVPLWVGAFLAGVFGLLMVFGAGL